MSSVYATEPTTSGRVIFETSHGPLDLQLWARECPATVRLFLQLCSDGFYDGMIFHRIVPSLLIQTGAVRRSSSNNNSNNQQQETSADEQQQQLMQRYRQAFAADEALTRRPYEINARIRFNHRGQVAMALGVQQQAGTTAGAGTATENDNGDNDSQSDIELLQPQFFITTEAAEYLDHQHVIFGTLGSGPTVFNAIRINTATAVDEATHQPLEWEDAPYIRSVKIVDNPWSDAVVPHPVPHQVPWKQQQLKSSTTTADATNDAKIKRKKRKGKLDVNVLSFGDEMGDVVVASSLVTATKKKSLASKRSNGDMADSDNQMQQSTQDREDISKESETEVRDETPGDRDHSKSGTVSFQPKSEIERSGADAVVDDEKISGKAVSAPDSHSKESENACPGNKLEEERGEKTSPSNATAGTTSSNSRRPTNPPEARSNTTTTSLVDARRAKYVTKTRPRRDQREEDTLARLAAFRGKVRSAVVGTNATTTEEEEKDDNALAARLARKAAGDEDNNNKSSEAVAYHGQILDDDDDNGDDDDDPNGWMRTKFKCRRHMDHEAGDGRDALKDYKVVDDRESRKRSRGERDDDRHHHRRDSDHHKKGDRRHQHHHRSTKEQHHRG